METMKTHALVLLTTVALGLPACMMDMEDPAPEQPIGNLAQDAKGNPNGTNGLFVASLKGPNRAILLKTYSNALVNSSLTKLAADVKNHVCGTNTNEKISADLLEHIAMCALSTKQSWTYTCPNKAKVTITGSAGVHQDWLNNPCGPLCQQKVSACIIAESNFLEEHIPIDLASDASDMKMQKNNAYTLTEGAYWGNIFKATPEIYGCYAPDALNHTYFSKDAMQGVRLMTRVCGTFHYDSTCKQYDLTTNYFGNVNTNNGDKVRLCDNICDKSSSTGNYTNCTTNGTGVATNHVVTVRQKKP